MNDPTTWKAQQERLRARMRNPEKGWATAQENLTWGEKQSGRGSAPAQRVQEQARKWNTEEARQGT